MDHEQCDQIGRLLKVLGGKLSFKNSKVENVIQVGKVKAVMNSQKNNNIDGNSNKIFPNSHVIFNKGLQS